MPNRLLTVLLSGSLAPAVAAMDYPPAPRLDAEVSWIGNSWSGNQAWVPQDIDDLFVAPDGEILTAIPWEEGGGNVTRIDGGGKWLGVAGHTHGWGYGGGEAVCANGDHVFIAGRVENEGGGLVDADTWPAKGLGWLGVSRRPRGDITKPAPFTGGKGGKGDTLKGSFLVVAELPEKEIQREALRGLAAGDRELFVSLRQRGRIIVYDAGTMEQRRVIELPHADRLALAADGRLWALQGPEKQGAGWRIVGLDAATGMPVAGFSCPDDWQPHDLAVGPDGLLYVADNGPAQQVRVLRADAGGVQPVRAIGVPRGILAGPVPGAVGPLRFNQPHGVGLDAAGNLYVASDGQTVGGGTMLESYTPAGELRWRRLGLHFVDLPDLDPRTMTVYSKEEIYDLDLGKPAGEQWSYRAYTCDPQRYPDDPRVHLGNANAWVRDLGGRMFLFTGGMSRPHLAVFRFDPAAAGELAIPCALFTRQRDGDWPAGGLAPAEGAWRWQDADGDGAMQAGEFAEIGRDGNNVQGMFPLVPDSSGRIWWGFGDELRAFAFRGLDDAGRPRWDWDKPFILARPDEFDEMRRVDYDQQRDLLVIGGGKGEARHQHWKPMGPVIGVYDHALRGTPKLRWTATLPVDRGASGHESHEPMSFAVAGDYLFVPYTRGLAADGLRNAFVKVLRLSDGACVGNLVAEDKLGELGLLDLEIAATARLLPDGRYLVFMEEDYKAKSVMFIWRPKEPQQ